MKDGISGLSLVASLVPAVVTATTKGSHADLQGYNAATLIITTGAIAGDGVLNVRLKLCGGSKQEGPEAFELSDAWLQDGTPVAPDALTFKLNTLADRRHSGSHYWIDSGSVYLK